MTETSWQSLAHSRWECKSQVGFIPKYRRKAIYGEIGASLGGIFHDAAVAQVPDDLEVRFIRGVTTYHLPYAGKRSEQAAADLQWVAMRASAAVINGQLDPALAAAAFYYHGLCREARADFTGAHAAWHEARALAPTSLSGQHAARRLQDHPSVDKSTHLPKR